MFAILKPLLLNRTVLLAVALIATLFVGYNWAYNRGKESQAPIIAALKADKKELERIVEEKRKLAAAQEEAYQRSLQIAKDANRATLAVLRVDLDRSQAEIRKLKERYSAIVPQYITQKADANCSITAGFIRLHNLAANPDTTSTTQDLGSARSGPSDADTPTTLKISTLGATIAENYGECRERLAIINAWQTWYKESKSAIDRAMVEQLRY